MFNVRALYSISKFSQHQLHVLCFRRFHYLRKFTCLHAWLNVYHPSSSNVDESSVDDFQEILKLWLYLHVQLQPCQVYELPEAKQKTIIYDIFSCLTICVYVLTLRKIWLLLLLLFICTSVYIHTFVLESHLFQFISSSGRLWCYAGQAPTESTS